MKVYISKSTTLTNTMQQMINNLAHAFKDKELIECYKTSKRTIEAQEKIIQLNEQLVQTWMEHFSNLNVDNQEQKKEINSLNYKNKEQKKENEKLTNTLKNEREWIKKFELENQEQKKEIDRLNNEIIWEWNEQVIGLKEDISELKEQINKLKTQLGDPFVPY